MRTPGELLDRLYRVEGELDDIDMSVSDARAEVEYLKTQLEKGIEDSEAVSMLKAYIELDEMVPVSDRDSHQILTRKENIKLWIIQNS